MKNAEDVDRTTCSNWNDVRGWLEQFPAPTATLNEDGDVTSQSWVFRGHRDSEYDLKPTIERVAESKSMSWAGLEVFVTNEFQARAPMHLSAHLIPRDKLTWLALMQHQKVPTRLLDFTYSPFVALYFAVRRGDAAERGKPKHLRLWAIDESAVRGRFLEVAYKAANEETKSNGARPKFVLASLVDFATDGDVIRDDMERRKLILEALSASGTRRRVQKEQGCVCPTLPPEFNPRLASQQGLFLLNCAEELSFKESLDQMMGGQAGWVRTLDIQSALAEELEDRLFQMNIHEQSLFPDMEGLADMIRQKARLHWK